MIYILYIHKMFSWCLFPTHTAVETEALHLLNPVAPAQTLQYQSLKMWPNMCFSNIYIWLNNLGWNHRQIRRYHHFCLRQLYKYTQEVQDIFKNVLPSGHFVLDSSTCDSQWHITLRLMKFLERPWQYLTLKEWFNGAPPWISLSHTSLQAVALIVHSQECAELYVLQARMCALSQYVVQQAALCSQLSSAVPVSLITEATWHRERERAATETGWGCRWDLYKAHGQRWKKESL